MPTHDRHIALSAWRHKTIELRRNGGTNFEELHNRYFTLFLGREDTKQIGSAARFRLWPLLFIACGVVSPLRVHGQTRTANFFHRVPSVF